MAVVSDMYMDNVADYYIKIREIIKEAERRAINRHKYSLSQQQGYDISFEVAAEDWFANHSQEWHERRLRSMLASQREEINRFKWIESERARRDLGRTAVEEWIHRHGPGWRLQWEMSHYDDDYL